MLSATKRGATPSLRQVVVSQLQHAAPQRAFSQKDSKAQTTEVNKSKSKSERAVEPLPYVGSDETLESLARNMEFESTPDIRERATVIEPGNMAIKSIADPQAREHVKSVEAAATRLANVHATAVDIAIAKLSDKPAELYVILSFLSSVSVSTYLFAVLNTNDRLVAWMTFHSFLRLFLSLTHSVSYLLTYLSLLPFSPLSFLIV